LRGEALVDAAVAVARAWRRRRRSRESVVGRRTGSRGTAGASGWVRPVEFLGRLGLSRRYGEVGGAFVVVGEVVGRRRRTRVVDVRGVGGLLVLLVRGHLLVVGLVGVVRLRGLLFVCVRHVLCKTGRKTGQNSVNRSSTNDLTAERAVLHLVVRLFRRRRGRPAVDSPLGFLSRRTGRRSDGGARLEPLGWERPLVGREAIAEVWRRCWLATVVVGGRRVRAGRAFE
jgi:hypothetical protein